MSFICVLGGKCPKIVEFVAKTKHPEKRERINQNFVKVKLCELTHVSTNDNFKNFICKRLSQLPGLSSYLTQVRDMSGQKNSINKVAFTSF